MKNISLIKQMIKFSIMILFTIQLFAQNGNVGIGINNPHNTAMLDVSSTEKGFLMPRLTSAQRDAISAPAQGLMIFNIASNKINVFAGTQWHELTTTPIPFSGFPIGFVHCDPENPTVIQDVINPTTGKTWMDRNLGASQVAISDIDIFAFGDLFQWGRFADGHHCRNSPATTTLSTSDQPEHGNFILNTNYPYDWRSPQNANLWQGVNGINNPCPSGYRIPTQAEFTEERNTWTPQGDAAGAFNSVLKLTKDGTRNYNNGNLAGVQFYGYYWTSTLSDINAMLLHFGNNVGYFDSSYRSNGMTVRCIKE